MGADAQAGSADRSAATSRLVTVVALLELMLDGSGALVPGRDDEILRAACVTREGKD